MDGGDEGGGWVVSFHPPSRGARGRRPCAGEGGWLVPAWSRLAVPGLFLCG